MIGFNTYKLRTSANPWVQTGVKAFLADKEHILACTQAHHSMEGRDPIRVGTVEQNKKTPIGPRGPMPPMRNIQSMTMVMTKRWSMRKKVKRTTMARNP